MGVVYHLPLHPLKKKWNIFGLSYYDYWLLSKPYLPFHFFSLSFPRFLSVFSISTVQNFFAPKQNMVCHQILWLPDKMWYANISSDLLDKRTWKITDQWDAVSTSSAIAQIYSAKDTKTTDYSFLVTGTGNRFWNGTRAVANPSCAATRFHSWNRPWRFLFLISAKIK